MSIEKNKKSKNLSRSFQMKTMNEEVFVGLGAVQYNISEVSDNTIKGIIKAITIPNTTDKIPCSYSDEIITVNFNDYSVEYTPNDYLLKARMYIAKIEPNQFNFPFKYYGPNSSINISSTTTITVQSDQFALFRQIKIKRKFKFQVAFFDIANNGGIIQNTTIIKTKPPSKQVTPRDTLNVKCYVKFSRKNDLDVVSDYTPIYNSSNEDADNFVNIVDESNDSLIRLFPHDDDEDQLIYYGPGLTLPDIPLLDSREVLPNQFVFYFYSSYKEEHRLAYFNLVN